MPIWRWLNTEFWLHNLKTTYQHQLTSVLVIKLTLTLQVDLTLNFGHPILQPKFNQISTSYTSYDVVCLLAYSFEGTAPVTSYCTPKSIIFAHLSNRVANHSNHDIYCICIRWKTDYYGNWCFFPILWTAWIVSMRYTHNQRLDILSMAAYSINTFHTIKFLPRSQVQTFKATL